MWRTAKNVLATFGKVDSVLSEIYAVCGGWTLSSKLLLYIV